MGHDRYMCLGCGKYWKASEKMEWLKGCCPYCGDMYYTDGIFDTVPPLMHEERIIQFSCLHLLITDCEGDAKFCPICRDETRISAVNKFNTMRNYQEAILQREGI